MAGFTVKAPNFLHYVILGYGKFLPDYGITFLIRTVRDATLNGRQILKELGVNIKTDGEWTKVLCTTG